jgi:hypothetical protein
LFLNCASHRVKSLIGRANNSLNSVFSRMDFQALDQFGTRPKNDEKRQISDGLMLRKGIKKGKIII